MRLFLRAFCLLVCCFLQARAAHAQLPTTNEGVKQPRILILLDGSSSMLSEWGKGQNRFQAAGAVVSALMDSMYAVNNSVEFGLRVYGQSYPAQENNCYDTKQEVMFSKDNRTQMALRLAAIHPRGVSPIAYSLQQAAQYDLENEERNAYSIILLTDGGESCNGDICRVVQELISKKIFFRPYIISMVDYQPLKQQYACLGSYLQVIKEGDVTAAIKTIVDEYRPLLRLPVMINKPAPVAVVPTPAVKVVSVPAPAPLPAAPGKSELRSLTAVNVIHTIPIRYSRPMPHTVPLPRITLPVAELLPPAPAKSELRSLAPVYVMHSIPIRYGRAAPRRVPLPKINFPAPEPVATKADTPKPKPVVVAPPKPKDSTTVTITKLPPAGSVAPRPTVDADKPKETAFTIDRQPAGETQVAIYFTDGRGKFYQSTPQLQFTDPKTGAVLKQFYRQVDARGEPDPQQLGAGVYKLLIKGKTKSVTQDIEVKDKMLNKIIVKVTSGSLKFSYAGAPNRPISEYEAIVNRRFEPGPVIKQRCTAELEYEPGNYYIEVNTLPISRFNTDIDFGSETEILIPQPGQLQIINSAPMGTVQFFYPLGDQYVRFTSMAITGNTTAQQMMIKPGTYEVRWKQEGGAKEKVQRFEVKSNSLTQIELE